MSIGASLPMTRRAALGGALGGMAALPLLGCTPGSVASVSDPATASLDDLARLSGRRFGSAISWFTGPQGASIGNPDYTAIINAECSMVVAENAMKWQSIRPGPDEYDFSRMDGIARWAMANGKALRGHTLLWHRPQWFPQWLNTYDYGANPVREAERILTEHIRTVTDRYRGQITSYDVVNEAIDHDTHGIMETSLNRALGSPEAAIDLAFHTTREQLPEAELVYNDYMSWEPAHRDHCADVLRLLEGMRNRGVPCDALGIQSHIEMFSIDPETGLGPVAEREWRRFLDEVTGMGYKLLITEFDVKDKALPTDISPRDAAVADFARRYFDLMLEYDELTDNLAWGMVDRFNWLQNFGPSRRDDGEEVRGTPYSSEYRAKPLRDAIAASFADAARHARAA